MGNETCTIPLPRTNANTANCNGVLGLVNPYLPKGTVWGSLITLYYKGPESLYLQVTTTLLNRLPFLNVLSLVDDHPGRNFKTLPSWVPDFSTSVNTIAPPLHLVRALGSPKKMFNACPYIGQLHRVDGRQLTAVSTFVGKVSHCSISSPFLALLPQKTRNETAAAEWKFLLDACYELGPTYRNAETISEAASEILTFIHGGTLPTQERLEQFYAMLFAHGLATPLTDRHYGSNTFDEYLKSLSRICGTPNFPTSDEINRSRKHAEFCNSLPLVPTGDTRIEQASVRAHKRTNVERKIPENDA